MNLSLMYREKNKLKKRGKRNAMKSKKKLRKLFLGYNYLEKELNKVPGIRWKFNKRQ